jgi:hypothetical protein
MFNPKFNELYKQKLRDGGFDPNLKPKLVLMWYEDYIEEVETDEPDTCIR